MSKDINGVLIKHSTPKILNTDVAGVRNYVSTNIRIYSGSNVETKKLILDTTQISNGDDTVKVNIDSEVSDLINNSDYITTIISFNFKDKNNRPEFSSWSKPYILLVDESSIVYEDPILEDPSVLSATYIYETNLIEDY